MTLDLSRTTGVGEEVGSQAYIDASAERALLGSIITDPEALSLVLHRIPGEEAFFHQQHREIYAAIVHLADRGDAIDLVTLGSVLTVQAGWSPDRVGYVAELIAETPTSVHAEHYLKIVLERWQRRRLLELAQKAAKLSADQSLPSHELLAQLNQEITHFLEQPVDAQDRIQHIGDVALQLCTDEAPRLFRTGFAGFDSLLGGGLRPGTMVVVAGRPGMGKSAFGLSLALNLARAGTKTAFASIEMSVRECAARLLANLSGVDSRLVYRLDSLPEHERDRVYAAIEILNRAELYIADRDVDTPAGIRSLIASTRAQVVVVDYLQHMQYSRAQRSRYQSRQEEVASISLALKRLTREYGVVMVALAQLNRLVELRSSAAPQLSDLRDSGQIEQDADAVLFLDRKDLRYTEDEWAKRFPLKPYPRGIVQVNVAKNRSGPVGEFELAFFPQYSRFLNTAPQAPSRDIPWQRRSDEEEEGP